jgi:hypothetical protein
LTECDIFSCRSSKFKKTNEKSAQQISEYAQKNGSREPEFWPQGCILSNCQNGEDGATAGGGEQINLRIGEL